MVIPAPARVYFELSRDELVALLDELPEDK
jgi:hypothetical protein